MKILLSKNLFNFDIGLILLTLIVGCWSSIHLGPVTLRFYLAALLFLATLRVLFFPVRGHFCSYKAKVVLGAWGMIIFWKIIAMAVNGSPMDEGLRLLVSEDFVSVFFTLGVFGFVKNRDQIKLLLIVFIFFVAVSVFVSLAQWLNCDWAWDIRNFLYPAEDGFGQTQIESALASGLAPMAFIQGYYLAVSACFLMPQLILGESLWLSLVCFFVMLGAVILQERSTLLAILLCFVFMVSKVIFVSKKALFKASIILILFGSIFVYVNRSSFSQVAGKYELSRMMTMTDQVRVDLREMAIDSTIRHPIFGVPANEFGVGIENDQPLPPHNVLLNALVYFGAPGFLLILWLLYLIVRLANDVWKLSFIKRDLLGCGIVMSLLAFIFCGFFHNASFLSGAFPGWFLVALLLSFERIVTEETKI